MNFFSDATHMELDFYHSLSCYLILGGGNAKLSQSGDCNWIIPDMARNIDTASAMLTKYIREGLASCADLSVSGDSSSYEGTSLRLDIALCHLIKTIKFQNKSFIILKW